MSNKARLGLVAAVVVAAVIALIVIKPGDEKSGSPSSGSGTSTVSTTSSGQRTTTTEQGTHIYIKNARPVGGVAEITVSKGDPVRLAVTSDTAGVVHIHGYNLMKDVAAGKTVRFDFPAKIDGVYEVELHRANEFEIAELKVKP